MLPAYLPWLLGVLVLVVLPVVCRLLIGDDPPANEISQEQPGDDGQDRPRGPAAIPLAA